MKCLLCSSKFKDQKEVVDHYLSYHNIDENNWFFQKLFQAKNKSLLTNCVRCNEFLTTEKHKAVHDFLRHYDDGKSIPFEEKPLDIKKWFKCSFNIENTQNSIRPDLEPLLNTRYWTTETYDSTYFNDFIFFGLRQDILKRVIINNMSGSAWHFKRFVYLALKVLDAEVEFFR